MSTNGTALVKASKALKGSTSTVRMHVAAVERASEMYLAQMSRAQAEYFDRIERARSILTGEEPTSDDKPPVGPETNQPTASA